MSEPLTLEELKAILENISPEQLVKIRAALTRDQLIPKPYVTVNNEVPAEPKSFFHSKAFLASGTLIAIVIGLMSYFVIFGH